MTVTYHAGFDVSNIFGGYVMSFTLTRAAQSNASMLYTDLYDSAIATSNTTEGTHFMHGKFISNADAISRGAAATYHYSDWAACAFATALKEAMDKAVSDAGWAGPPTFTVSFSGGLYTITVSDAAAFGITWSADATERTCRSGVLGFTADLSGAASYAASYRPFYYTQATLTEWSEVVDSYEPDSIAGLAMADSGAPADAIARTISPKYLDWTQQFEPKNNTYYYCYSAPTFFTFEKMFEHCRTVYPFLVSGSHIQVLGTAVDVVCLLRPDGSAFAPSRPHPDYDDYWHIPFRTVWVAYKAT